MSYLIFLLILDDKEYLEDVFILIKLLLKHNHFKNHVLFEYELACYFHIKKRNMEEVLKSIDYKFQIDKLSPDYFCACQNVLVEYTAAIKLFKKQSLVDESKNFLLENHHVLLTEKTVGKDHHLVNYFHAAILSVPEDKQFDLAKAFMEFVFIEFKTTRFDISQFVFNSLTHAITQSKINNRYKIIFLQMSFDRFYKFLDTLPEIKPDKKLFVRFTFLQGMAFLNKQVLKKNPKASNEDFLVASENPYPFLCDYYFKMAINFFLIRLKFTSM